MGRKRALQRETGGGDCEPKVRSRQLSVLWSEMRGWGVSSRLLLLGDPDLDVWRGPWPVLTAPLPGQPTCKIDWSKAAKEGPGVCASAPGNKL